MISCRRTAMKNPLLLCHGCAIRLACVNWPCRVCLSGSCEKWQLLARFSVLLAVMKRLKPLYTRADVLACVLLLRAQLLN